MCSLLDRYLHDCGKLNIVRRAAVRNLEPCHYMYLNYYSQWQDASFRAPVVVRAAAVVPAVTGTRACYPRRQPVTATADLQPSVTG